MIRVYERASGPVSDLLPHRRADLWGRLCHAAHEQEVVEKRKWATNEEVMDYYAVGQCTPGIIAVNTATFIGYKQRGVIGGIAATAGVIFPSIVIISIIAACLQNFADLPVVQHAFGGIRVAVAVLVTTAIIKLWKTGVKDKLGIAICIGTFVVQVLLGLSPVYIVIAAILLGIAVKTLEKRKGGKAQ